MRSKIMFIVLMLIASMAFAVNTVTTGTLTLVSGTTYKIASGNYYKANLLLNYVIGDSTSVTITISYRYTDPGLDSTISYVASIVDGSTNIATDDAVVLNATAARQIPLNTSKRADWIYITVTFTATGATPGTLLADIILDYNQ